MCPPSAPVECIGQHENMKEVKTKRRRCRKYGEGMRPESRKESERRGLRGRENEAWCVSPARVHRGTLDCGHGRIRDTRKTHRLAASIRISEYLWAGMCEALSAKRCGLLNRTSPWTVFNDGHRHTFFPQEHLCCSQPRRLNRQILLT